MASLTIEQVLHGYDHGHGLLASSVELTRAESALSERLSDLSGYLPPGLSIPSYLTTFPCGRFYAVARTWPDRSGRRAGTVLTHTLLVPISSLGELESLAALTDLHREPLDISDRGPYRAPLDFETVSADWAPAEPQGFFAAFAAMLFGRSERPVTVVTSSFVEHELERLWRVLWRSARERLAVCTFALGVRRTDRTPFDLLIVPPAARTSIVEVARSPTWWDETRGPMKEVPGVQDQPWFTALLEHGPAWRDALSIWCEARELPMPAPGMVARLERIRALEESSRTRVAAARSRVDAIGVIWPRLPPHHPVLRESIRTLVSLQVNAADLPSPLRSLCDLVERPLVTQLAASDPGFNDELTRMIRQEVHARALRAPAESFAELPRLASALGMSPMWEAAAKGAADALSEFREWQTRWRWLFVADDLHVRRDVLRCLFGPMEPEERSAGVHAMPSSIPRCDQAVVGIELLRVAHWSLDARLLLSAYDLLGQTERGERRSVAMVLSHHQPDSSALAAIEKLPLSIRLKWCLGWIEPRWHSFAARHGARWIREGVIELDSFAAACAKVEHGRALLCHWLELATRDEAKALLHRHEDMARRIVHAALTERDFDRGFSQAVSAAIASLSDGVLCDGFLRKALTDDAVPEVADTIVGRLFPTLVRAFASDTLTSDQVLMFDSPAWLRCMDRSTIISVRDVRLDEEGDRERRDWTKALAKCWMAFARWFFAITVRARVTPTMLLIVAIRSADASAWDAAANVGVEWFANRPQEASVERLAAEVLVAIKQAEPSSAPLWIQVCFPMVYPPLRSGTGKPFANTPWRPYPGEWDEAAFWREWVTRLWFRRRWPVQGYLQAFRADGHDLREALATVEGYRHDYEFFGAILDVVEVTPSLMDLRPMLAELYNRHKPYLSSHR